MKFRKSLIVVMVLFLVSALGAYVWSATPNKAQKLGYTISNVEATDDQLQALDEAVFGKGANAAWGTVLPRGWGLVQHEVKGGKIIPHTVKHLTVPMSWLRGTQRIARAEGRFIPSIYLFGCRVEDQINAETGNVWQPFFRGITVHGSVVAGLSLRRMAAAELRAVVRVIGTEITVITFTK